MNNWLADVVANPDDNDPRLAYAAAIAAQDPERSRLIALQLQFATAQHHGQARSMPRMYYEIEDLLAAYGNIWTTDLSPYCNSFHFHRGFVEHIGISMQDFLAHGEQLLQLAPIRHLDVRPSAGLATQFFQSPLLQAIRSLHMDRCQLEDDDIDALAASPYLSNLAWLELMRNDISMRGAHALAASTTLPALRYVGFFGNPADPTEELFYDQGIVVGGELPEQGQILEAAFGIIAWLHPEARTSQDFPPARY